MAEDKFVQHVARKGESLYLIARARGISVKELAMANPEIKDPAANIEGQTVQIPLSGLCPNGFLYTIQPGDTFFLLAQRFGTTVQAIQQANSARSSASPRRLLRPSAPTASCTPSSPGTPSSCWPSVSAPRCRPFSRPTPASTPTTCRSVRSSVFPTKLSVPLHPRRGCIFIRGYSVYRKIKAFISFYRHLGYFAAFWVEAEFVRLPALW